MPSTRRSQDSVKINDIVEPIIKGKNGSMVAMPQTANGEIEDSEDESRISRTGIIRNYNWENSKPDSSILNRPRTRRSHGINSEIYGSMNESFIEDQNDGALFRPDGYNKDIAVRGRKSRRRNEVQDLLAAQGKHVDDEDVQEEPGIYYSVKSRVRVSTRNNFYADFLTGETSRKGEEEDESQVESTEEEEEEDNEEENEDEEEEEEEETGPRYKLRKVREAPQRYTIAHIRKKRPRSLYENLPCSPARRMRKRNMPSRRSPYIKRRMRARARAQGSSSTSDESYSDDEVKFRKRQRKSMKKARNECLPINLSAAEIIKHSFSTERKTANITFGADIDPMAVDSSVNFDSVGGLHKHIQAIKEMVVFPLRYPEFFKKFNVVPPRGCLFYGPPGTGKTLLARALANECSVGGHKVSFFMKKGADCLSKWVGESERQLRILFDQAYQMRPSIIFFDEIDGLAPVRSSRQDQIHSSIVSTLLALLDGLDNRGEIIVIGATNRIDAIDPALRRPGRFDREFQFLLPDKEARASILRIHTKAWDPPLRVSFVDHLATKTSGYCGADLRALCAEASLVALRRRYPQIYDTWDKLQLDSIIPASQRAITTPGRALSAKMKPLLEAYLEIAVKQLVKIFPVLKRRSKTLLAESSNISMSENHEHETDDALTWHPSVSIYSNKQGPGQGDGGVSHSQYKSILQSITTEEQILITVNQPRFLVCGDESFLSHIMPALLHDMEGLPIHCLDLTSLYGTSIRTPEESCAQVFREARRVTPSVIYLPDIPQWYAAVSVNVRALVLSFLKDIPSDLPILFLASSNCSHHQLPSGYKNLFDADNQEVYRSKFETTSDQRTKFFAPLFLIHAVSPPPTKSDKKRCDEVLEKAVEPEPAPLTKEEERLLEKEEESTMINLRLFLRDVLSRLARDTKFKIFAKPVDPEEVPDYAQVIENPMDFETMETKIDQHKYQAVHMFLDDIKLICNNALEYNPDRRPEDKKIRHRACNLRDLAHAIIESELEPQFEKQCLQVIESRRKRNLKLDRFAPKFQRVLPKHLTVDPSTGNVVPKSIDSAETKDVDTEARKLTVDTPRKRRTKRSSWSRGILRSGKKRKQDASINQSPVTGNEGLDEQNGDAHSGNEITQMNVEEATVNKGTYDEGHVTENGQNTEMNGIQLCAQMDGVDNVEQISTPATPSLVVDRLPFFKLLVEVELATKSFSLYQFERAHILFSRCIDKHKMARDRTMLLMDLENEVRGSETAFAKIC